MTENKRFREVVSIKTIKDNVTGIAYTPCLVNDDFLDLINTLAKENEELKSDYDTLQIQDDARKQYQKELMKENEQLKQENRRAVVGVLIVFWICIIGLIVKGV